MDYVFLFYFPYTTDVISSKPRTSILYLPFPVCRLKLKIRNNQEIVHPVSLIGLEVKNANSSDLLKNFQRYTDYQRRKSCFIQSTLDSFLK